MPNVPRCCGPTLAMFPAPAALAQALGSDDADGPLTDAADDLRGIRGHLLSLT